MAASGWGVQGEGEGKLAWARRGSGGLEREGRLLRVGAGGSTDVLAGLAGPGGSGQATRPGSRPTLWGWLMDAPAGGRESLRARCRAGGGRAGGHMPRGDKCQRERVAQSEFSVQHRNN